MYPKTLGFCAHPGFPAAPAPRSPRGAGGYAYPRITLSGLEIETEKSMHSIAAPLSEPPPETLEDVVAHAPDPALLVRESGTVVFANDQACRLFNYDLGELHGLSIELLIPKRFRMAHVGRRLRFTDDRSRRPMGAGLELFALCKDGSERRVDISLIPAQRGLETLMVVTIQERA